MFAFELFDIFNTSKISLAKKRGVQCLQHQSAKHFQILAFERLNIFNTGQGLLPRNMLFGVSSIR
ncbi:hypothetical protein AMTR_s00157p00089330 [Amborella trichopoda]|uniref:Uncharacterized protein n=1 Tax=Amborella trichopoda TaxID=13333 RepID=W1PIZ9_AMBTC|nr:hypothetical protein AMTR_s00157p00089330 [Amborella trichopoda]